MVQIEHYGDAWPGGRGSLNEDRAETKKFRTNSGLNLAVAAVADGVGGEEVGEAAAQAAIDTIWEHCTTSNETDILTLLRSAVARANTAARQSGGNCTLAIACIDMDLSKLYIANVGDSRVYFCNKEKILQLTHDHSFANIMVQQGKLSRADADVHPRAHGLWHALGPLETVPVDIGIYIGTEEYAIAQQTGKLGIELQDGDSIIVCSDGVTKASLSTGRPYVQDAEMKKILFAQDAENAVKNIYSTAMGRKTDDNVGVAVLKMPNPNLATAAPLINRFHILAFLATIIFVGAFVYFALRSEKETTNPSVQSTAPSDTGDNSENNNESAQLAGETEGDNQSRLTTDTTSLDIPATSTPITLPTLSPNQTQIPIICADASQYKYRLFDSPNYKPASGTTLSGAGSEVYATYTIIIDGDCPLHNVQLQETGSIKPDVEMQLDGESIDTFWPGDEGTLKLIFSDPAALVKATQVWGLTVSDRDGKTVNLYNLPSLSLETSKVFPWLVDDSIQATTPVVQTTPRPIIVSSTPQPATPTPTQSKQPVWNATGTARTRYALETASALQAKQTRWAVGLTQTAERMQGVRVEVQQTKDAHEAAEQAQTQASKNQQATSTHLAQQAAQVKWAYDATQTAAAAEQLAIPTKVASPQPTQAPQPAKVPDCANSPTRDPEGDADGDGKKNKDDSPEYDLDPCNPDTDGDGFRDNEDLCPSKPGLDNGCSGGVAPPPGGTDVPPGHPTSTPPPA
ncbi:MAG: protein phosphatase 2C domain-containing protein [Candidatus Promineifilaceae bacterium]